MIKYVFDWCSEHYVIASFALLAIVGLIVTFIDKLPGWDEYDD